jgi:hypothetical protein
LKYAEIKESKVDFEASRMAILKCLPWDHIHSTARMPRNELEVSMLDGLYRFTITSFTPGPTNSFMLSGVPRSHIINLALFYSHANNISRRPRLINNVLYDPYMGHVIATERLQKYHVSTAL